MEDKHAALLIVAVVGVVAVLSLMNGGSGSTGAVPADFRNSVAGESDSISGFVVSAGKGTNYFCSDSGQINFYKKGEVSVNSRLQPNRHFVDSCMGGKLNKYYCGKDNTAYKITFKCPFGCMDGACAVA